MELSFSDNTRQQALMMFTQIEDAIRQVTEWSTNITSEDDYYTSSNGMQNLAASCMIIEAIGEAINRIDKVTEGALLPLRPEVPWSDIIGTRNHIAHGYFDIDGGIVFSIIRDDLPQLNSAVQFSSLLSI